MKIYSNHAGNVCDLEYIYIWFKRDLLELCTLYMRCVWLLGNANQRRKDVSSKLDYLYSLDVQVGGLHIFALVALQEMLLYTIKSEIVC